MLGRRLCAALVAAALGVVVLSNSAGTWARWVETTSLSAGQISAGSVTLAHTDTTEVRLLSQQRAGWRTYTSDTHCAPEPYRECRVVTSTLAQEQLIPGDRLVITEKVSLNATGTNLAGTFTVDTRGLLADSEFARSATVDIQVAGTSADGPSEPGRWKYPVNVSTGTGLGTYTVTATISTPPSDRWMGQSLINDGGITYTFVQSNPQEVP